MIIGDDGESAVPFTLQDDAPQSFDLCHPESLRLGHVIVEEQLSLCVWASAGQKIVGFLVKLPGDMIGRVVHPTTRRNSTTVMPSSPGGGVGLYLRPMTDDERTHELCRIVHFMVRSIADQASSIVVEPMLTANGVTLVCVQVSDSDRDKVIGKDRRVEEALRHYVRAFQEEHGGHYGFDILGQ